ncbi:MAG TPA: ribosome maturation factor RimM [bacterium]|nr:ribosome maturation factor RimM [bacterium]
MSNPDTPPPQPNEFTVLGTIVRPHGLKGQVKVSLSCSGLERLAGCPDLRLVREGRELKKVSVAKGFLHNDGDAVLLLREVSGVDEAEALRGAQLCVPAGAEAPLPEDSYYLHDLKGLRVETTAGEPLGVIDDFLETPANWVCVAKDGGKETLIPALKSVIRRVDFKGRRMVVELPEEIDEADAD